MYIQEKLKEAQKLVNNLEGNYSLGIEEQLEILSRLQELIGENPTLIKYQCICLYNAGFIDEARDYITEMIKKHQQNFELHSLMFELFRYTNDYEKVFYALAKMYKLAENESIETDVLKMLEDYTLSSKINHNEFNKYFNLFKLEIDSTDYRNYPINEYGQSIIRENAFPNRDADNEYLANMYKSIIVSDINSANRMCFLYETVKGKFVGNKTSFDVQCGDIIAVSSANKEAAYSDVVFHNIEDKPCKIKLEPNLFRYYKIRKDANITIESNRNIFVSHFKMKQLYDKPRLVLQIFIDGFSYQFLKENGFEKLMPNTYKFFEKGYINENCHANGEWTLPSLMSMCTGKFTTNHYVYDTNAPHKGEVLNKFVQEYFEEAGYMTGRICGNWRATPSYGYFKSTGRSIYSPLIERMSCSESIAETLEHLESFKDFYNYTWLTIEDLHTVADGLARGLHIDVNTEKYLGENVSKDSEISVFRAYNEKKIEEYKSMMRKIDFYLGILYQYIESNYSENEYVITINSDHGQGFITEDEYLFSQKRTNVPFMLRGRNVICKKSNELMSNVDILPVLLHVCGLQNDAEIDGILLDDFGGGKRIYTISESIFPGQTYKLAINDNDHILKFETKENVRKDGLIIADNYSIVLKNRKTGEDETEKYPDKIDYYTKEIFEHIKEWIVI